MKKNQIKKKGWTVIDGILYGLVPIFISCTLGAWIIVEFDLWLERRHKRQRQRQR